MCTVYRRTESEKNGADLLHAKSICSDRLAHQQSLIKAILLFDVLVYVCALVYVNICMHELCTYMCRYAFMCKPLHGIQMRWQFQPVGLGLALPLRSLKRTSNIHISHVYNGY